MTHELLALSYMINGYLAEFPVFIGVDLATNPSVLSLNPPTPATDQ